MPEVFYFFGDDEFFIIYILFVPPLFPSVFSYIISYKPQTAAENLNLDFLLWFFLRVGGKS